MDFVRRDLPTYHWASSDPTDAGVTPGRWDDGLPRISREAEVRQLPDAPTAVEDDLVPIEDPRIRVLGAYFHEGWPHAVAGAYARPGVVRRLLVAVDDLPHEFGLAIWDAWRDPRLQAVLHDTVYADDSLPPGFVAYPDPDPRHCPPHASGGTLDLTLTFRNVPLSLGTGFDAFVPDAAAAALEPDGPELTRDLRRLLALVMTRAGFVQHPQEWWHWEFGTRYWAAVTGLPVRFGHAIRPDSDRAR